MAITLVVWKFFRRCVMTSWQSSTNWTNVFYAYFCLFFPAFSGNQRKLGLGLTFSAHEHVLIQEALEAAQRPGLVQAAFVATHAGYSGRHPKGTAPFFGFVPEPIARNFCWFVFTHVALLLLKYEFKGSWFEWVCWTLRDRQ